MVNNNNNSNKQKAKILVWTENVIFFQKLIIALSVVCYDKAALQLKSDLFGRLSIPCLISCDMPSATYGGNVGWTKHTLN